MKTFEVVQNIPSPYRLHMFNELWRQLTERGYSLHVNFMSEGHAERPESWRHPKIDFPHTYWKDCGFKMHHLNPGMIGYLRKARPDIMLVGSPFDTFTSILVSFLCPARVRCAWVEGQTKTPGEMSGFVGNFKRLIFSKYPYAGVPGMDGKKYFALHQALTSRKMPETLYLPNLIDETRFRPRGEWPNEKIADIRAHLGAAENDRVCLLPARFDPVKGLVELAALLTPEMIKGWRFIIMGEGPCKQKFIDQAKRNGVLDRFEIVNYVPYEEMPQYYAAADLCMLPSLRDANPLAVVEALHSGLPMALSVMAGNVEEAVSQDRNGWRLQVDDINLYRKTLQNIFVTPIERLREMGRESLAKNARFWCTKESISRFIDGLECNLAE